MWKKCSCIFNQMRKEKPMIENINSAGKSLWRVFLLHNLKIKSKIKWEVRGKKKVWKEKKYTPHVFNQIRKKNFVIENINSAGKSLWRVFLLHSTLMVLSDCSYDLAKPLLLIFLLFSFSSITTLTTFPHFFAIRDCNIFTEILAVMIPHSSIEDIIHT